MGIYPNDESREISEGFDRPVHTAALNSTSVVEHDNAVVTSPASLRDRERLVRTATVGDDDLANFGARRRRSLRVTDSSSPRE